jgi:hypothetical protein
MKDGHLKKRGRDDDHVYRGIGFINFKGLGTSCSMEHQDQPTRSN